MAESVVCRCDPAWPAYAKCERCSKEKEAAELHRLLLRRGQVQDNHPVRNAFDTLIASYDGDELDREYDRAEEHEISHLERFWTYGTVAR